MDKIFFFKVWGIYQDHWGKEEQDFFKKKQTATLLMQTFQKSRKMRALSYMRCLLTMLWGEKMFIHENELLDAVRDMSDACLGEDYDDISDNEMDPYTRMMYSVHQYKPTCYLSAEEREWKNIQNPSVYIRDVDIYSISAILALP